jgi:hypothetical protein
MLYRRTSMSETPSLRALSALCSRRFARVSWWFVVCSKCKPVVNPNLNAGDGRVFALKQVKVKGMKRVDREEAIDEVWHREHLAIRWIMYLVNSQGDNACRPACCPS